MSRQTDCALWDRTKKARQFTMGIRRCVFSVDEGRKRVLGIIAGIVVARHLKTTEDLSDTRPTLRTENLEINI